MDQEKNSSKDTAKVICEIPIKFLSLNGYVDLCRGNKYDSAKYKKDIEILTGTYIRNLPRFEKPVKIGFHWIEANARRDPDNIAFAKKFILDALVRSGKLKDDNRRCVTEFRDTFGYGKPTRVILTIEEEDDDTE